MLTEKYPIDVERLNKGDYIQQSEVERLMGVNFEKDHKSFNFALMTLVKFIETTSKKLGSPLLCCSEKGGVRILTDSDALVHRSDRHKRNIRSLIRTAEDVGYIDGENLTNEEKSLHDREMICQSRIVQSVMKERKKLKLEGYVRSTPLLGDNVE